VKREAANVQIFKRARRVKERVYERYFLQRRCKSRIDSKSKGLMERCLTRVTAEGWVSTLLWQYQAWESRSLRALSSELSRRTVFLFRSDSLAAVRSLRLRSLMKTIGNLKTCGCEGDP
jgi:hypothetical protein